MTEKGSSRITERSIKSIGGRDQQLPTGSRCPWRASAVLNVKKRSVYVAITLAEEQWCSKWSESCEGFHRERECGGDSALMKMEPRRRGRRLSPKLRSQRLVLVCGGANSTAGLLFASERCCFVPFCLGSSGWERVKKQLDDAANTVLGPLFNGISRRSADRRPTWARSPHGGHDTFTQNRHLQGSSEELSNCRVRFLNMQKEA